MDAREAELPAVEIAAIRTKDLGPQGCQDHVGLEIEFRNAVLSPRGSSADRAEKSWFDTALLRRIMSSLGLKGVSCSESTVGLSVKRENLEGAVRTIYSTVAEFRESYGSVLDEHNQRLQARAEEEVSRRGRLEAHQRLIDRVMDDL